MAAQEADAPQVVALLDRIRSGEHDLTQAEMALAMAEHRLEQVRSRT
ncbi:hypothetical protein [Saccharopolyspora shandongensis]